MNILVVEDSRDIALLFQLVLEGEGHKVDVWTSSFASIAKLAPWDHIDVIIADQELDGYDGKNLFRWLAEVHPGIRRVMVTGSRMTDEKAASADLVLIKPLSAPSVLASVVAAP